ncbi:hypothetical protein CLIB1423_15S02894 [[Candida] railenensis]|uniref:Uncharacterized protein n=1 Tax=[Candida] railenensis TaxID=45579 RepID=A0A9P0QSR4_9ASCO|nr:hypothetical protein CLIB1423_15S02894 [[Candida] railenensis]
MFGLLSSRPITKVPNYDENDSIDLQIKSLLYVFKRLQVNKFSSFYRQDPVSKEYSFKYIASYSGGDSSAYYDKLDSTYNLEGFKGILLHDEYRVMIDYGKNKYRSLCIVSELPSPNLSRPGSPVKGEPTSTTHNNHSAGGEVFPPIVDYKDRPVKNFGFVHLPCENISIDMICNVLAHSPIYVEYVQIGFTSRYQYAKESVEDVVGTDNNNNISKMTLSKRQHALIIRKYLTTLAFNVQLSRIYEEYVRQSASSPLLPSPSFSSPHTSPRKVASSTSLSRTSSSLTKIENPAIPSPSSPTSPTSPTTMRTLKSKPSISKLKLNELYTPVMSAPSSVSNTSESPEKKFEIQLDIWEKCKNAVNEKILRERRLLAVQRDRS